MPTPRASVLFLRRTGTLAVFLILFRRKCFVPRSGNLANTSRQSEISHGSVKVGILREEDDGRFGNPRYFTINRNRLCKCHQPALEYGTRL